MTTAKELLDQDFGTLGPIIAAHGAEQPNALAIVDGERRVTYAEFDALVHRVAAGLQRDGVKQRAAVAICALSSIEYAAVFVGGLRAGIAVSPLAPSSTPEQLIAMLDDCAAPLFFLDDSVWKALSPLADRIKARRIAMDASSAGEAFQDWLPPVGSKPDPVEIKPEDPFNIIYSSGTTGTPKGIVQSHGMRWNHIHFGGSSGYGRGR